MGAAKAGRRTVKNLVREFKADRVKNANVVVDIMDRLESNDEGTILSAITGLHHIFSYLLTEGVIGRPRKQTGEAQNTVNAWLRDMYEDTLKAFLSLLGNGGKAIQELSLSSLLRLLQAEGRHPFRRTKGYGFPLLRLKAILSVLVSDEEDRRALVGIILENLEFEDFQFYSLIAISDIVKAHMGTHPKNAHGQSKNAHTPNKDAHTVTSAYMNNIFPIIERIKVPTPGSRPPLDPPKLFLHPIEEEKSGVEIEERPENYPGDGTENPGKIPDPKKFSLPYPEARVALNVIWGHVLSWPLTPDLYRCVLVALPDKAMPHMDKPLALTGFLMESYNMGGAISLLALQGVFILINKHDLDYPDFYRKLYALLEPSVFQARYRARFFMLCDRFLSSSHLPEYLMASFVKRLSRLSLSAPSGCLPFLLRLLQNLLLRSPGLIRLIHRPDMPDLSSDPFDPSEPDPALTKASESSLWEVRTLESHIIPSIGKVAAFTRRERLPDKEVDLGTCVEADYEELFQRAAKVQAREGVAVTFRPPKGLFFYPEDTMTPTWGVCDPGED